MPPACRYCLSSNAAHHCEAADYLHGLSHNLFMYYRCRKCGSIYRNLEPSEDLSNYYPADYGPYLSLKSKPGNPLPSAASRSHLGHELTAQGQKKDTRSSRGSRSLLPNTQAPEMARSPLQGQRSDTQSLSRSILSLSHLCQAVTRRKNWIKLLQRIARKERDKAHEFLNHADANVYALAVTVVGQGATVCDFGCGSPRFLEALQKRATPFQATGVDMVAHDPQPFLEAGVSFLTVDQFWQAEEKYTLINMNHVLEHIPDPDSLCRKMRTKLQHGGALLVTTPNAGSVWSQIFKEAWYSLDCPRHLNIPTPQSIRTLAKRTGYSIIKLPLQYKYSDYTRSLYRRHQLALGSLLPHGGMKDAPTTVRSKLRGSEQGFLQSSLEILRIAYWFCLSLVNAPFGRSDRLIVLMVPNTSHG